MAEVLTATRSQVAITAGRKAEITAKNRTRELVIDTPAAWSATNGDTAGTGLILPAGARLLAGVGLSCAAGTASSTLSVGLRDPITKVALDATAIINAASIASASTGQINTGTKIINGQFYTLPQDCEVYLTFGGANPTANQAIRIEVPYVAP